MTKYVLLIAKNLRRNVLRTALVAMGTMVLVLVVTLVWSVLYFLDGVMAAKTSNLKAIVTERWQIPSQMPFAYAETLVEGAARNPGDVRPMDAMTWQFFGGTLDLANQTRDTQVFAFAMEPSKLATMMDDLDSLPARQKQQLDEMIATMNRNRQAIVMGPKKLEQINKRVGDHIMLYSFNYRDIQMEFDIVGELPPGRYEQSAVMHRDYLNLKLDEYNRAHPGKPHPMTDKTLNLVWVKVPNNEQFSRVSDQIERSPLYAAPAVKCETASSGIAGFLDPYKDMIWGLRWLLTPAVLITLALVISNAISISVRERRMEMAVLKVLGFQPTQLLFMVMGEALLVGITAGIISGGGTYWFVNNFMQGIPFPIAFFPVFFIPINAVWWGLGIGAVTSLAGSIMPAWNARKVKVSDVFSKVA